MKTALKHLFFFSGTLFLLYSCAQQPTNDNTNVSGKSIQHNKKLIYLGWEIPTTQILSEKYKMMEETSSFDGITFNIRDTVDGNIIHEDKFFTRHEIKREWLQNSLNNLKSCKFKQFTDNFVRITTVPDSLTWTDDKAWAILARNMGNVAWFAKEAGIKGISYDSESYTKKIFEWHASSGLTYAEAKSLVRKRGREVMTEMGKEYPEITFWGLFLFSLGRSGMDSPNIDAAFSDDVYALYPSFLNGFLDALPAKAKIVEGNEDAYYCPDREELLSLYIDSKNKLTRYVEPENLIKFQTQYSVGLGLYADMYSNNTPTGRFYFGEQSNRNRIERFRDRLQESMDITDEYVWIYNEGYKWWDIPYAYEWYNTRKHDSLMIDAFPQINNYMKYAKNPISYASEVLASGKILDGNLAVNGTFDEKTEKAKNVIDWSNKKCPPGYLMYTTDTLTGSIELVANEGVNKTACARATKNNCNLIQQIIVTPGDRYVISVDGKKSAGEMNFGIYWMDKNENLVNWYQWKYFSFQPMAGSKWSRAVGVVTVPNNISSMGVLIRPKFSTQNDTFWFDNVKVYPLNSIFK